MQANIAAYRELSALKFNKQAPPLQSKQQPDVWGCGAGGEEEALPQNRNAAALVFLWAVLY